MGESVAPPQLNWPNKRLVDYSLNRVHSDFIHSMNDYQECSDMNKLLYEHVYSRYFRNFTAEDKYDVTIVLICIWKSLYE